MEPSEFLTTAKQLLKNDTASNCRTIIGRSYYAVYNVSWDLLKSAGVNIGAGSSGHGIIPTYLNNCGIQELKEAQQLIVNLHADRIKADYNMNSSSVEKRVNAEKAIKKSETLIQTLRSYKTECKLQDIKDGIQKYKKKIEPSTKR